MTSLVFEFKFFELGRTDSRQIKVAQPHQRGCKANRLKAHEGSQGKTQHSHAALLTSCASHVHVANTFVLGLISSATSELTLEVCNGVMGEVMIIGDHLNKNKFNIERFVILSAFANKGEINDHVA